MDYATLEKLTLASQAVMCWERSTRSKEENEYVNHTAKDVTKIFKPFSLQKKRKGN